jgi:hypothetical protein
VLLGKKKEHGGKNLEVGRPLSTKDSKCQKRVVNYGVEYSHCDTTGELGWRHGLAAVI